MLCPYCGAYSPKNTSVCNRCGRRLPMLENQQKKEPVSDLPEYSGYGYGYRQPPQTEFQKFLERVGTFLDDIIEDPFAKRVSLAIILTPVVVYIILRLCGVCGGCFRCGPACLPEEEPVVSAADALSGADAVVSGSSVSLTDAPATETSGTMTAA